MDGWMDGRRDGWMDGWMDGGVDGLFETCYIGRRQVSRSIER